MIEIVYRNDNVTIITNCIYLVTSQDSQYLTCIFMPSVKIHLFKNERSHASMQYIQNSKLVIEILEIVRDRKSLKLEKAAVLKIN